MLKKRRRNPSRLLNWAARRCFETLEPRQLLSAAFAYPTFYTAGGQQQTAVGADFNGDGSDDFAVVNGSNSVSVFLNKNDFTGAFNAKTDYATAPAPISIAVGNFNGDGKLDMVTANSGSVSIFLNNGSGGFLAKTDISLGAVAVWWVVTGDFNGDTKTDFATITSDGLVSVFMCDGNGNFTPKVDYAFPNPVGLTAGDFNGDNKLDLAAVSSDSADNVALFINNGNGTFAASEKYTVSAAVGAGIPGSISAGDFDGDGAMDLVTSNNGGALNGWITVFKNIGGNSGKFAVPVKYAARWTESGEVLARDFDGDGKADVAISEKQGFIFYRNHGDGTLEDGIEYQGGSGLVSGIGSGDFNRDGRPDLLVTDKAAEGKVAVVLNAGDGVFASLTHYNGFSATVKLTNPSHSAIADFNKDGFLDAAVLVSTQGGLVLMYNLGNGSFGDPVHPATLEGGLDVVSADFNKDGKPDLAVARSQALSVYLNLGNGNFSAKVDYTIAAASGGNMRVTTSDFNKDGKMDVAVLSDTNNLSILMGIGNGTFLPVTNYAVTTNTVNGMDIQTADFNGDTYDDIAITGGSGINIYYNDKVGGFATHTSHAGPNGAVYLDVLDYNNDDRPDLVLAATGTTTLTIYQNLGSGNFSSFGVTTNNGTGDRVVNAGDYNGDGFDDLASMDPGELSLLYGNGLGQFTGLTTIHGDNLTTQYFDSADLNNDGRIDLVISGGLWFHTLHNFDLTPHPPIASDVEKTALQETPFALNAVAFAGGYESPDGIDIAGVRIVALPTHGTLLANGLPVAIGDAINDLTTFEYVPAFDFIGEDAFGWQAYDGRLFSAAAAFNFNVLHVNHAPTDIALSANTIVENKPANTVIGTITGTDRDAGDKLTYVLCPGAGADDNALFAIAGGTLKSAAALNFDAKAIYSVRVRTTDQDGLFYEKVFSIAAVDVEEMPVALAFSKSVLQNDSLSLSAADFAGAFSDQDTGAMPHTLTKVKITALPKKGALTLDGAPVVLNQEIAAADLDLLDYTPNAQYLGSDAIGWNCSDGALYGTKPAVLTIRVVGAEIALTGNALTINTGDATPASTDGTDFGLIALGSVPIDQPFVIKNAGTGDLTLGAISLPAGFTLQTAPASTVAPGQSTTFVIRLDPTNEGIFEGTVSFSNNDTGASASDVESPFEFGIRAEVVPAVVGAINAVSIKATKNKSSEVSPATTGKGLFTLTRSGPSLNLTQAIKYVINGSAESGVDFLSLTGVAVFAAKKPTATINLQPILDALAEGDEQVTITLIADVGATYSINGTAGAATATVADGASVVTVTANKPLAKELGGSGPAGAGQFTFKRTGGSTVNALTVHYSITGTASNDGSDFAALSGVVIIPAGKTSAVVNVNPVDDFDIEGNETIVVTIDANLSYFLPSPNNSATMTIADHNRKPTTAAIAPLVGIVNSPKTITFADLIAATGAADPESEPIVFKIKAVTKGTLTKNGVAVQPGVTTLAAGEEFVWTPPNNLAGMISAFSLTASDGVNVTSPLTIKVII